MSEHMTTDLLAFFGLPGWQELLIIGFVGLLLFGKRLPEVARSLGKSVVEFKKGIRDMKDEIDSADSDRWDRNRQLDSRNRPPLPKPASHTEESVTEPARGETVETGTSKEAPVSKDQH